MPTPLALSPAVTPSLYDASWRLRARGLTPQVAQEAIQMQTW
jgi:hypothetical protein